MEAAAAALWPPPGRPRASSQSGTTPVTLLCTAAYGEEASGERVELEARSSKRLVELCVHDAWSFHAEPAFSFALPVSADPVVTLKLRLHEVGSTLQSDPMRARDCGHACALLLSPEGEFCGRVHLRLRLWEERGICSLQVGVCYVAQLQLPGEADKVLLAPAQLRGALVVAGLYFAGGLLFFCRYMKATLMDAIIFSVNVVTVTGLTDIMDTPNPDNAYDPHVVQVFLIGYMLLGVVVLFTFVEAGFHQAMEHLADWVDSLELGLFRAGRRKPSSYLQAAHSRVYLFCLMVLFALGCAVFHATEGWDWVGAAYYTCSVMITVGFTNQVPGSLAGNAFLVLWMPVATLMSFFVLSDYLRFRGAAEKERRRRHLLHGLLRQPDDLVMLADDRGLLTRYDYVKYMLLRLQSVDPDELQAIEERFNSLDTNGDGTIAPTELPSQASSGDVTAKVSLRSEHNLDTQAVLRAKREHERRASQEASELGDRSFAHAGKRSPRPSGRSRSALRFARLAGGGLLVGLAWRLADRTLHRAAPAPVPLPCKACEGQK